MKRLLMLLLLGCFCYILASCGSDGGRESGKILSMLKAEDVSCFSVTLRPPDEEFTVTDENTIAELVDLLQDVTVLDPDDSYSNYNGQWVEYHLTMSGGGMKTIAAYNPFIIIDGIGYQTEYEPCEKLNAFANDLYDDLSGIN